MSDQTANTPTPIQRRKPLVGVVFSDEDRAKVSKNTKTGNPSECWEWLGGSGPKGYGAVWLPSLHGYYRAHRIALAMAVPITDDSMIACHHCDNPQCVNPSHLYWGSEKSNANDARRRGRMDHVAKFAVKGSASPSAKLTEDSVRRIRERFLTPYWSYSGLAKEFQVSEKLIGEIRFNRAWKHVVVPGSIGSIKVGRQPNQFTHPLKVAKKKEAAHAALVAALYAKPTSSEPKP